MKNQSTTLLTLLAASLTFMGFASALEVGRGIPVEALEGKPRTLESSTFSRQRGKLPSAEVPVSARGESLKSSLAGTLGGRVLDEVDQPVANVSVLLLRGHDRFDIKSDSRGTFLASGLPTGRYRVFVIPAQLPQGVLAPHRQQQSRPYSSPPSGLQGTSLLLTEGDHVQFDLRVFQAASLRASIRFESGAPTIGGAVRLRSESGVSASVRLDSDGRFDLSELYPGDYRLDWRRSPAHAWQTIEEQLNLLGRESRTLPTIWIRDDAPAPLAKARHSTAPSSEGRGDGGHHLEGLDEEEREDVEEEDVRDDDEAFHLLAEQDSETLEQRCGASR